MSISIQTNVSSLVAQQNLSVNNDFQSRTITRLTSGYRINASGDDAAGLAIANKFRSDTAELTQGVRNANDGVSTLQIIDGGLNNISKMVDRLKTLATQSATTTFTGDRATVDAEYQTLLGEINRQAANIGLNGGGRYNTQNTVYIGGGGSNQSNSQIKLDLSGASNAVDTTGLGLVGTSVGGGGTGLNTAPSTPDTVRLDAPGATFASAAQSFAFNVYSNGTAHTHTVTVGGTGALTSQQVLDSLNGQLSVDGITASIGSGGTLQFGGGTAFTVKATTSGADKIATNNATATNTGVYESDGAASYTAPTSPAVENLTFQNGLGTKNVAITATESSVDLAIAKINAQTSSIGVYAVKNTAGTGISFQSATSFSSTTDTAGGVFTATGPQANPTSPVSTTTGNATSAITAINNAVGFLGLVQGRVGADQNKLQYAIGLATSQISNFSAAESRIRDADVAAEAANLTKAQVLQQASLAAMAQANSAPQAVLSLLRG